MPEDNASPQHRQVGFEYIKSRLARALLTGLQDHDEATRNRAKEKAAKWLAALHTILDGGSRFGSRTPIRGIPAWVTLEVLTGGFATENFPAGGELQQHEIELLSKVGTIEPGREREAINTWYLTEAGLNELNKLLDSNCYKVTYPEEGALLSIAYLMRHGRIDAARNVITTLAPFMHKLRFFPRTSSLPRKQDDTIFLRDVAATIDDVSSVKVNEHLTAQKEAVTVWAVHHDRVVALFLETLVDGRPGGTFTADWRKRARRLQREYNNLRSTHKLGGKAHKTGGHASQLREFMMKAADTPQLINNADLKRIQHILTCFVNKRGVPGSRQHLEYRKRQAADVSAATHRELAGAVVQRLELYDPTDGLKSTDKVLKNISSEESDYFNLPAGSPVPDSIKRKVNRCRRGTMEDLVSDGIIPSTELVAAKLPLLTADIRARGFADRALQDLYAAIYRSFRRRRSLLLLNLQSQVKIDELPWIAAIEEFRTEDMASAAAAMAKLKDTVKLALNAFPHTTLPNKFLRELRALSQSAGAQIPFVDELAADIFTGTFTFNFVKAAHLAAELLQDSLYARYYDIDYQEVLRIDVPTEPKASSNSRVPSSSAAFTALCRRRAKTNGGNMRAMNGMILEQQQIVTSQNLAGLFVQLNMFADLQDHLPDMARRCFIWICRRLQMKQTRVHARLIAIKNSAYAWRHMLFYLSLLETSTLAEFCHWMRQHLQKQRAEFQVLFHPAVNELLLLVAGQQTFECNSDQIANRIFLGWSDTRHWLM